MRKVRIAQIGMNRYSHAEDVFYTLKNMPDIFDLVGYALVEDEREIDPQKLSVFEGYRELTVEEILNDDSIEAVAIETDEIHLTKYAIMAAKHGKHIHMEKPGSQSLEMFEELISCVKSSQKILHLGYMYRYNPYVQDTIMGAKNGDFGEVYSIEAHMSRLDDDQTRKWFGSFNGGMMFYLGCHLVDLVVSILGTPTEIIPLNTMTGINGILTEDLGVAVLKYPNAISIIRMGGCEIGGQDRRQLVVCGSKKTVEIRPLEIPVFNSDKRYMYHSKKTVSALLEDGSLDVKHEKSRLFSRYEEMMVAFASMICGEKENPYTLEYELELFRTIMKCCGSQNITSF